VSQGCVKEKNLSFSIHRAIVIKEIQTGKTLFVNIFIHREKDE